ncbi:MAG: phosphoketolase family protein [Candidatus Gracilibacteria bacterium]|jgi:xylulose-5-phosphate/fructose-6-phosphate phosphoketolase|nr:phosphoketolase family protein [Candidatus Gracilibacteria bacterium]
MAKTKISASEWLKIYNRYLNYLSVAMIYLRYNHLLEKPLKIEDIKLRPLGHFGSVPGTNLIYSALNYLICKTNAEILFINGPGHGAPANLANLFADGSLAHFYKDYSIDLKGMKNLIKDFSWPYSKLPSHVTPSVPGSILEGGELGYSLSTAFGAALDNPKLIVACVIGDGEAETAPLAGAWYQNKFLNPKKDGAVLPIVHLNNFKISNSTVFSSMGDDELTQYFKGLGYEPLIIKSTNINKDILKTFEKAYSLIKNIQTKARKSKTAILKPKWPVIILHSKKGLSGPKEYNGHPLEDSFRSHGVPIGNPMNEKDPQTALKTIENWLKSYKFNELIDKKGHPLPEVLSFVPKKKYAMGLCRHAFGGDIMKALKLPKPENYEIKVNSRNRGTIMASSMIQAGKFIRDSYKLNKDNFRLFCPDELESNKLSALFEYTKRGFQWPLYKNTEETTPEGRTLEILSEHTIQGWLQGYLLTGRHGVIASYESFTAIINSMVDQHAKFLRQSELIKWRRPISSALYIQTSVGWRQEHNGYSHQNPSFVSNILQKHSEFTQIYYPADANMLIVAMNESLSKKGGINVIVSDKREIPQWLTMKEAKKQAEKGIGIWEFVSSKEEAKNPDIVLATAGDYITQEGIFAVKLIKEIAPEIKIRFVNISELTAISLGDLYTADTKEEVNKYFTKDKPVIFSYHGYVSDIKQILWNYTNPERFTLHGYEEKGSTTTPFDLKLRNGVSRYQLAKDLIESYSKTNKKFAKKSQKLLTKLQEKIDMIQKYIITFGDDPDDVKKMKF